MYPTNMLKAYLAYMHPKVCLLKHTQHTCIYFPWRDYKSLYAAVTVYAILVNRRTHTDSF